MTQQFTLTGSMVEHLKLIPNDTQLGEVLATLWHHKIDGHELTCKDQANQFIINLLKSDIDKANSTRDRQRKSRDNGVTVTRLSQTPSTPSPQEKEISPHTPYIEKELTPPPTHPARAAREHVSEQDVERLFDFWYRVYPRKVSKVDAYNAFKQALRKQSGDVTDFVNMIRQSVINNAENNPDWKKDNGRFIPYPATWLRGEKWNDEFLIDPTSKSKDIEIETKANDILNGLIK